MRYEIAGQTLCKTECQTETGPTRFPHSNPDAMIDILRRFKCISGNCIKLASSKVNNENL